MGSIKAFHTLLSKCGIDKAGKEDILAAYGVSSSKELNYPQLNEICQKLQELINGPIEKVATQEEKALKRVKAAAGNYLALMGKIPPAGWGLKEWNLINGVICRAAQVKNIKSIPLAKLNALYNGFRNEVQIHNNIKNLD